MRSTNAALCLFASLALAALASPARAAGEIRITLEDALHAAQQASPELLVARAQQSVAEAEVRIASMYPNPIVSAASTTQTAKVSGTVSIPLVVLGQRGAAIDAARADEATVGLSSSVAWNDARQLTVRAYVALWLAEGVVDARRESAAIESALEASTVQRVDIGSAPRIDALRVHAERLRSDADVLEAIAQVSAAGSDLGRWMGVADGGALRASREPAVPDAAPALDALLSRIDSGASVRREQSDVLGAQARVDHERALVRPMMTLDLGFDAFDPTLPQGATNYRALLAVDVPIFHQRGGYIERERSRGDVARARVRAARAFSTAELTGAYRTFEAATARQRTLADEVVPAVRDAARAMEEAYALGRAPLVAVLDAERALVDTRLSALQAQAARANAWAAIEHAVGGP